jgi:NAD(P)H dehydrogenase (quinone)
MGILAVTGSTGVLGGMVARDLAGRGIAQRLLVRDPSRAPQLDGAEVVRSDYGDTDLARRSLEGVTTLFMVSAHESAERLEQHASFIDAAAAAGVEQIVYTSFVGASPDSTFTLARDHAATEQPIAGALPAHTFLRDNFYLDFLPHMVGEDGVLRGPAGAGRVAAVARADIARSAVAVLLDPGAHRDATYDLTGPEALAMAEVAAIITRVTGREVSFHDETLAEAYESRLKWPAPQWQYDAWVSTYTAIAAGEHERISPDVERLTGRRPISLSQFLVTDQLP